MQSNPASANRAAPVDVGFADKPMLGILRRVFPLMARVAPALTARLSLRLFLTPQRHRTPQWETAHRAAARKSELLIGSKKIALYTWGPDDARSKVLLCHAWGGRATQMGAFIEPLITQGYKVIAFDAPAHGASHGRQTDMMEYSATIHRVIEHHGGVDAIIGHSFGAGNVMFSKHLYAFNARRIALIGCFAHGSWVTDRFGEILNIPDHVISRMRRLLEKRHANRFQWSQMDIAEMVKNDDSNVLIIHDSEDKEIPYFNAEVFQNTCGNRIATLTTEGLGHRRIVRNPVVVSQVCEFIALEAGVAA